MDKQQIEHVFTYHPPDITKVDKLEKLREEAKEFALMIQELAPVSEEQSTALLKLREVLSWASSAIILNE